MVGREITQLYPEKQSAAERTGESILSVQNLGDGKRFHNVSFELRKGEILGIGGLIGSGRTEIAEGICGLRRTTEGEVRLLGNTLSALSYADSVRAGVVYLSEDRKGSGVFLDLSIAQNIAALDLKSLTGPFGLLNAKTEAERAHDLARRLGVRMGGIDMPVSSLSGGNQQKVVVAREFSRPIKLLIAAQPTPFVLIDDSMSQSVDGRWADNALDHVRNSPDLANRPLRFSSEDMSPTLLAGLCRRGAVTVISRADMHRLGFELNVAERDPKFEGLVSAAESGASGCFRNAVQRP